jgi:hypothetical protein
LRKGVHDVGRLTDGGGAKYTGNEEVFLGRVAVTTLRLSQSTSAAAWNGARPLSRRRRVMMMTVPMTSLT